MSIFPALLFFRGRNKESNVLLKVVWKGHADTVQNLLNNGVDVNTILFGSTVLMYAAHKGHTNTVRLLLDNGAYVNAKTEFEMTALKLAESRGHKKIAELLNKHGAKDD